MRYLRYASIAVFGLALILIGLANRNMVTLKVWPDELAGIAAVTPSVQLPLFVVIFASIVAGILVGFVWEWFREHRHRADAARKSREVSTLQREVRKLKGEKNQGKDEVLALLE